MEYTKDGCTKCAERIESGPKGRKCPSQWCPWQSCSLLSTCKDVPLSTLNVKNVSFQNWSQVFVSAKLVVLKCSFQNV